MRRMLFGSPPARVEPDPLIERLAEAAKRQHFADGWASGTADTLRLVLGQPIHGVEPYRGELPDELREWAEAALIRTGR